MTTGPNSSKRGIFFTLDSVFAILILVTLFSVFALLSVETVSTENMHQLLRFQAEDAVIVLARTKLWEVRHLPVVQEMEASGTLVQIGEDYSIMEVIGALWGTNESGNMTYAKRLVQQVLGPSMPPNVQWSVVIANDTMYNTSDMSNARFMSTVSNRMVSGYMKGRPHVGFSSRAFLSNIKGKSESAYVFFGGFVGQGEVTTWLRGIPSASNITGMYIEMTSGSNITLYINGTKCADLNWTENPTKFMSWNITSCKNTVNTGKDTKIVVRFREPNSNNLTNMYIGGGYMKAVYETSQMAPYLPNKMRYYFPGINGAINIFDSFYVPGRINSITGWVNISSNFSNYINVGNVTIFSRASGRGLGAEIYILSDGGIEANLTDAGVTKSDISNTTIPVRFGTPEESFLGGNKSDVILVTDVSGSMALCADQDETFCRSVPAGRMYGNGVPDEGCGYGNTYFNDNGVLVCANAMASENCTLATQKKTTTVKEAENGFLDVIFSPENVDSRVGIIDYSASSTGRVMLPDINLTSVSFNPQTLYLGSSHQYTFTVTVRNDGFAPVTTPFTIAILFPSLNGSGTQSAAPVSFLVNPVATSLDPGESRTFTSTVTRTFTSLSNIVAWADCGGQATIAGLSGQVGSYVSSCSSSANETGVVHEYVHGSQPEFEGYNSNNWKTASWSTGINLFGIIKDVWSTPNYTTGTQTNPSTPSVYSPVICTTKNSILGRQSYNQTIRVLYNLTNLGNLGAPSSFKVKLLRRNLKCNYYETVNLTTANGNPDYCDYYMGRFECGYDIPIPGNPVLFTNFPAAGPVYNGTFIWDIENYTPPVCPSGQTMCTAGADCNDFNDPNYNGAGIFELKLLIDSDNQVFEDSESDNERIFYNVYMQKPDLRYSSVDYIPSNRCHDPNVYIRDVLYGVRPGGGMGEYCIDFALDMVTPNGPSYGAAGIYTELNYFPGYAYSDSFCPLYEPFNVSFWTRDEWCINSSGTGFAHNCNWVYRNSTTITTPMLAKTPSGGTSPTAVGISLVHVPLWTSNRTTSGGLQGRGQCIARSVGQRNTTSRLDTWGYIGNPASLADNTFHNISERYENNNWDIDAGYPENGNARIDVVQLAELSVVEATLANSGPDVQNYCYGNYAGVCEYVACYMNRSRENDWHQITLVPQITVSNGIGMCNVNTPFLNRLCMNTSGNCSSSPYWLSPDYTINSLRAGYVNISPIGYWPNKVISIDRPYYVTAVADVTGLIPESTENNNIMTHAIFERPADLVPYGTSGLDRWFIENFGVNGVYVNPGTGNATTCYGAKTLDGPNGPFRYAITGPVMNNHSYCSFFPNFTISIGLVHPDSEGYWHTQLTPFYLPSAIGLRQWFLKYYDDFAVNITTQLENNYVGPGTFSMVSSYKTVYWNGITGRGLQDYQEFVGKTLPLFVVVNDPRADPRYNGLYHLPAEENYSNNWYIRPDQLYITYEAPELAIKQLNYSSVPSGSDALYTINVSILNNRSVCNTNLQATGINVTLYKGPPGSQVPIETRLIGSLGPRGISFVQFTYLATDTDVMRVVVDSSGYIGEMNETNNWLEFPVYRTGSGAPTSHNPSVLLSGQTVPFSEKAYALLLQGVNDPFCLSITATPNQGNPLTSTITATFRNVAEKETVLIDCGNGDVGTPEVQSDGTAIYTCDYADKEGAYYPTANYNGETCTTAAVVTNYVDPICLSITASPNEDSPTFSSTIQVIYMNVPEGENVNIQCDPKTTSEKAAVDKDGKASITCSYDSEYVYSPSSDYGGVTSCTTRVLAQTGSGSPTCSLVANPSVGTIPFTSTLTATYTGLPDGEGTYDCGDGKPQPFEIKSGTGTFTCSYSTTGTYTVAADYSTLKCLATITAQGGTGACSDITSNPTIGAAPLSSTVIATYKDNLPGTKVIMRCNRAPSFPMTIALDSEKQATIICNYSSIGEYYPTSEYGGSSCESHVSVVSAGPIKITATPNTGSYPPTVQSLVEGTFVGLPVGTLVGMRCGRTGAYLPTMNIPLDSSLKARILCNYTEPGTFYPRAAYGSAALEATVLVSSTPGVPSCTLTPNPTLLRALIDHTNLTAEFSYANFNGRNATFYCSSSQAPKENVIQFDEATVNCTYEETFSQQVVEVSASATSQTGDQVSCTSSVTVNPGNYACPNALDQHIYFSGSPYNNAPLYSDNIIGRVNLTSNEAVLRSHINNTNTLLGTCICCGIIDAVEMFRSDWAVRPHTNPASIVLMTDGNPTQGCAHKASAYPTLGFTGNGFDDTIKAACLAYENNITVYTIGFGTYSNTTLLNDTAHACGGNGQFYYADNRNELLAAYRYFAELILNVSFTTQKLSITGTGFTNSSLDSNSYLEFDYTPNTPSFGWNDIAVSLETPEFHGCYGEFDVSGNVTPYSATATSYSQDFWTKGLWINDSQGFSLDRFCVSPTCRNYQELGDPFNLEFNPALLHAKNNITYYLGYAPTHVADNASCGNHSKVLYKATLSASVPFSGVLPSAWGENIAVYYDLNGDGVEDGNVTVAVGQGLVGVPFKDQTRLVPDVYNEEREVNSITSSFLNLLEQLNFNKNTNGCSSPSEVAGSKCNPIDVYLDPNKVAFRASSIFEVPYMWGPVDVGVRVWIE